MNYQFVECNNFNDWNNFVKSSPQGTLFCFSNYLNLVCDKYRSFFVMKNDEVYAGVLILLDSHNKLIPLFENYQGILYSNIFNQLNSHSRIPKMLEVTNFILFELKKIFSEINLSLHYSINDLRSFQWYNYHEDEDKRIDLKLRYTCLLNLLEIKTLDDFLFKIRRARRREYNNALKNGLIIEESNDISILDNLHHKMFLAQGIKRSKHEINCLKNIAENSINNNFGKLFICFTKEKIPCSTYLFLFDDKHAYSKFGATDPIYKNTGAYTFLTINCILKCIHLGLQSWDFLGANSPRRGDYKISFNGYLKPYYELKY